MVGQAITGVISYSDKGYYLDSFWNIFFLNEDEEGFSKKLNSFQSADAKEILF